MNLIVTGGLGFIGSHISKRLVEQGETVWAVDNLHTGKKENLPEGCEFKEGSAGEIGKLGIESADAIFHEGIYSSSPMYREDRFLVSKAVSDFVGLMEFAREKNSNVIVASTSSLYNGVPCPQKESAEVAVNDFYTEARYFIERVGEAYSKIYGMDVAMLRYFSVYGPGEGHKGRYANLVSQIIWANTSGKEMEIYGDGIQGRDFVYIDDVVNANLLAMRSKGFGVFNVGTGKEHTLNQVMEIVENASVKKIDKKYVQNPIENYVEHTCADTRRAEEGLGFRAEISLEEGVRKILEQV